MIHDTFNARYGLNRTIKQVGERTYHISGKSRYSRGGGNPADGNFFLDFEGGPFIGQGMKMDSIYEGIIGEIEMVKSIPSPEGEMCVEVTLVDSQNKKTVYMEDIREIMVELFGKIKQLDGPSEFESEDREELYKKWWEELEAYFGVLSRLQEPDVMGEIDYDKLLGEYADDARFWQERAEHYRALLEKIGRDNPDIDVIAMAKDDGE